MAEPADKLTEAGVWSSSVFPLRMRGILLIFGFLIATGCFAERSHPVSVDIFLSTSCPACQRAYDFFKNKEQPQAQIEPHFFWINLDKQALRDFYSRLERANEFDFTVPSFFFCGSHWKGFSPLLQQELIKNIQSCQTLQQAQVPAQVITTRLQQNAVLTSYLNQLVNIAPNRFMLPLLAMLDVFNPCSFFFLITFLIFIFIPLSPQTNLLHHGVAAMAGLTLGLLFILTIPNQLQSMLSYPLVQYCLTLPLGIWLLLYVGRSFYDRMFSKVATPHEKTGRLIFLTCCLVYGYQQTCLYHLSQAFHLWSGFPPPLKGLSYGLALIGYLFFYLLIPISIFLLACARKQPQRTGSERRLGKWSVDFGHLFLGGVSLLLIVKPQALVSVKLSVILFLLCALLSGILLKWKRTAQP